VPEFQPRRIKDLQHFCAEGIATKHFYGAFNAFVWCKKENIFYFALF
jgi:hypothetical protein